MLQNIKTIRGKRKEKGVNEIHARKKSSYFYDFTNYLK